MILKINKWHVSIILFCSLLLFLPKILSAHAYIVSSSPTDNEILTQSPKIVYLVFNEPIEAAFQSLTVTGPSGERVDQGNSYISPDNSAKLMADLKPDLPDGVYTLKWKVLSGDGHNISGVIAFQIGNGDAGSVTPTPISGNNKSLPDWDLLLIRLLQYSGFALYIGSLMFHLFLLPHQERNNLYGTLMPRCKVMLLLGFGLTATGILLSLPQQVANDAAVSWGKVWDNELIKETLHLTTFGEIWGYEALLLLILSGLTFALVAQVRKESPRSKGDLIFAGAALLCSMGILLCKAFIGHAATANWKSAAVTADFLHLAAASIWIGGVVSLAFLLPTAARNSSDERDRRPVYWKIVRRFSVIASLSVIILLATGIYSSLLYIPTPYALFHTDYGRVLIAKGALMVIMLVLGLTGFLRGRRKTRPLGPGVWIEFSCGILVLFLAAILSNLAPATAISSPGPATLTGTTPGGYKIAVVISPNTVGQNHFKIELRNPDGEPLQYIEQVTLSLASTEKDMGNTQINLPGNGPYEADGLITKEGRWNVSVHVLLKSLEVLDQDLSLTVGK